MKVVYIKAAGSIREQRANVRNGDNFTWKMRSADEDGQFTRFEELAPWDACISNDGALVTAETAFVHAISNLLDGAKNG
jgi:dephospho-CoA kinase